MNLDKLIDKIKTNKKASTTAYYKAVEKIIKKEYAYFKDKDYAKKFLEEKKM